MCQCAVIAVHWDYDLFSPFGGCVNCLSSREQHKINSRSANDGDEERRHGLWGSSFGEILTLPSRDYDMEGFEDDTWGCVSC